MRRDLQTFCPKDCRYNSGSFCLLPFDTPCPHCTYSSGTSLFGCTTRFVAIPYGRCPVCGAEGPCDVVAGEPTQVINYGGTVEYLFRCPKCHEVSWVQAYKYEYTVEPVSIQDDVNMVDEADDDMIDDEKPIKSGTGTTCIICGEEYEIKSQNDGRICEKCKSAIKRLREIFEDVDAESEELDSSEGTEDGTTTVGATTDEPMVITLYGDELHGMCGDTDGDVTWFIGQVCDEPDEDETDTYSEPNKPDDDDEVYPMECPLCDLCGEKPCVPNTDSKYGRCSHCKHEWCAKLEKRYAKVADEDHDKSGDAVREEKPEKEEVAPSKEPVMTLKDFVARFLVDGMQVEILCDDYVDVSKSFVALQTLGQYIVADYALYGCPKALLAANVLAVRSPEYSDCADIAIHICRVDGKKTEIRGRDGKVINTLEDMYF